MLHYSIFNHIFSIFSTLKQYPRGTPVSGKEEYPYSTFACRARSCFLRFSDGNPFFRIA
jgi:hypothetical protein